MRRRGFPPPRGVLKVVAGRRARTDVAGAAFCSSAAWPGLSDFLEPVLTDSTPGWRLGRALQADLDEHCRRWDREGLVGRLWRKDAGVWTGGDEARWLGWLDPAGAAAPILTRS